MKLAARVDRKQPASATVYPNAGMAYANPDAVTSIGNGVSTTTYAYDNNGNLTQVGSTTYLYDYQNRITSIGFANSTSTFGYDSFGARVFQAATTSTTTYASKYFSISSTTVAGANWATTTAYVWLGDTLLGTVDRQFKTGAATGTAKTRYVHTDHLGSMNVVTDEGANLVQTVDYYPFGATRISVATSTNQKRKYIGQFADDSSGLQYLNARYYDLARGQFLTQDPQFWAGRQKLKDPQSLNSYSYGDNNPITRNDPSGEASTLAGLLSALSSALSSIQALLSGGSSTGDKSTAPPGIQFTTSGGSILPASAWKSQMPDRPSGCLEVCREVSGYTDNRSNAIDTTRRTDGKLITQGDAQRGVEAINNRLGEGRPITVGVNWDGGTEENANPATQHFILIVGSGIDQKGIYYRFFDSGTSYREKGTSPDNRLYMKNDYSLKGSSAYNQSAKSYVVTEVRQ